MEWDQGLYPDINTDIYTNYIYIVDLFRLLLKKYLINRQNEENLYVNIVILKSYWSCCESTMYVEYKFHLFIGFLHHACISLVLTTNWRINRFNIVFVSLFALYLLSCLYFCFFISAETFSIIIKLQTPINLWIMWWRFTCKYWGKRQVTCHFKFSNFVHAFI